MLGTESTVEFNELLVDPQRVRIVRVDELPVLLASVQAYRAQLAAVEAELIARTMTEASHRSASADQLLTVQETAERLSVTVDWLRRQKTLPFRVELSPGQIRYSSQGLARHIRIRQGA